VTPEELCDAVQRLILPPPSPFPHATQKWRRPAVDCAPLAPLYADHSGPVADSLFGQVATGNLFAPKPGTLALHDPSNDFNPFFGVGDRPSRKQRLAVAPRLEASLLQPKRPYELVSVGRSKNARKINAQRFLKLPADLGALLALIQCCEKWDTTGERAALAPFILREQFRDPDCREIFDDILEYCGIAIEQRQEFFAAHAADRDKAFDRFVAMDMRRARGNRHLIFRGLPDAERATLERRQIELIEIERRRALKVTPLPNTDLEGESLSSEATPKFFSTQP
jgi:hypothetical protein